MKEPLTCAQLFQHNKFIPVVILNDIEQAIPIAHALLEGGISVMEVTLRSPNALAIIEKISHKVPQMTIGAGTILTDDHYHMAISHGAQFIVSPGLTTELAQVSRDYNVPFLPGAITPTEVMQANLMGFNYLKFFPAASYNGCEILKALSSPFANSKFCPTGSITLANARQYLALPNVVGVGCSFFINASSTTDNDYAQITQLAQQALTLIR